MAITKSELKQIIKEEILRIEQINELDAKKEQLEEKLISLPGTELINEEIQKGRFTTYCKKAGFKDGAGIACAKHAMASDNTEAHKMATFYINTVKPNGKKMKDLEEAGDGLNEKKK